jgi:THO complex subunit 4
MLWFQDYFGTAVGPVKSVLVNYGPNGRSRGSATIIFSNPSSAARALELDGVRVDNRTLRVCNHATVHHMSETNCSRRSRF